MHAAPPVEVDLAGGHAERVLIVLLHALAAGVFAQWLTAQMNLPEHWLLLGLPLAAWLGWRVACALLPRSRRRLGWTGQGWQLRTQPHHHQTAVDPAALAGVTAAQASGTPLAQLHLQLDAGAWLLLRWQQAGTPRVGWGIARAAVAGAGWHGLRVALQAHAGAPQAEVPQ
jgi:hypothetical protein